MDDLNPHQFGDQLTLFHAPLGQEEMGLTRGNPHARIYRSLAIPEGITKPQDVLDHVARARGGGYSGRQQESLGLHWQHDLPYAQDLGSTAVHEWGNGEQGVILEADHPGHEHVLDFSRDHRLGPPEDARKMPRDQSQSTRDWHTIQRTVGPQNMLHVMLPEVPIRPGAPLRVHAVHVQDENYDWVRHPVQFKGQA